MCALISIYIYFSKHITMRHRREATMLQTYEINARSEDTQNVTLYRVLIY